MYVEKHSYNENKEEHEIDIRQLGPTIAWVYAANESIAAHAEIKFLILP